MNKSSSLSTQAGELSGLVERERGRTQTPPDSTEQTGTRESSVRLCHLWPSALTATGQWDLLSPIRHLHPDGHQEVWCKRGRRLNGVAYNSLWRKCRASASVCLWLLHSPALVNFSEDSDTLPLANDSPKCHSVHLPAFFSKGSCHVGTQGINTPRRC